VQRGTQQSHLEAASSVGVLEAPGIMRAQCVVLDEFLAPHEVDELVAYALQQETRV
jgi:hypothetical protein